MARPSFDFQQPQFLHVHGLQRQPPLVQLQVDAGAFVSIFLSMVVSPVVPRRQFAADKSLMASVPWYGSKHENRRSNE